VLNSIYLIGTVGDRTTKKRRVMVVDDNPKRANLIKEELESRKIVALDNGSGSDIINCYQVDVFLGSDNYKKALEALETCPVDSSNSLVIANERLGLITGGGRTGLFGEYAESGLLFCYNVKKAYHSMVKATMVIATIKGYSTSHGFYNVGALREVVDSLGISGYITKPINNKNISRVVKKIERVFEKEEQERKDPLLPLSYMSIAEWMALSAQFKTKKLHKLIDNHIRTVELINANIPFYPFKSEEVYREMVQKLGDRIMKSVKYIQQVVEAIDRDVLSEERVLKPLFGMWIPDKKPFEEVEENRKYAYWNDGHYFKGGTRRYISNVYGNGIAKAKFNSAMENLLRGSEYVACIEAELENFLANVIKAMAKETIETRIRIKEGKELTALKDLFDEIITIRERLKGSIIHQQRQLRIFSEELRELPQQQERHQ
jgi:CheY-like chemotaxis protein